MDKKLGQIFKLSKRISNSLLRGKKSDDLADSILFDKEDKCYIMEQITNKELVKERDEAIAKINKEQSWRIIQQQTSLTIKTNYYKYAIAASIVIIIGVAFFIKNQNINQSKPQQHTLKTRANIPVNINKTVLTLEDGENVYLGKTESYKNANVVKQGENLIYNKSYKTESKNITYNYLTIPRGEYFFVQLEDGTKVWLNAESKLKYPVQFPKNKAREVELMYGEAYFDVAHSSKHNGTPFSVIVNNQTIKVLGTQFNVRAYKNSSQTYTTLVKGKVNVNSGAKQETLKIGHQSIVAKNSDEISIKEVDIFNEISWYKGVFIFDKQSLKEITNSLSRTYDVHFQFKDVKKKAFIFSGLLKRDEDIDSILKNIEKTGEVTFEINNSVIVVK